MESDPQSSKFSVSHATTLAEALGSLPSIAESTERDADEIELGPEAATEIFRTAIGGRPQRVKDKSRLRYVMYRSGAVREITRLVLKLMPAHPEHIDSFAAYLQNYSKSAVVMRGIIAQLQAGVLYDYVQGELWLIASRLGETIDLQELLPLARARGRGNGLSFSMQRGLTAFFLSCARAGVYPQSHAMKRFGSKSPFVQSLLIPYLADSEI